MSCVVTSVSGLQCLLFGAGSRHILLMPCARMSCLSSTLLAVLVLLTTVATYGLVLMVHAVHALTPPPPPMPHLQDW
jgi:hypothetical protein